MVLLLCSDRRLHEESPSNGYSGLAPGYCRSRFILPSINLNSAPFCQFRALRKTLRAIGFPLTVLCSFLAFPVWSISSLLGRVSCFAHFFCFLLLLNPRKTMESAP